MGHEDVTPLDLDLDIRWSRAFNFTL